MHRHSFAQYKSDTALNITARRSIDPYDLLHGNSLELDDTDEQDTGSDTTEVIYPPTDQDSDLFARSVMFYRLLKVCIYIDCYCSCPGCGGVD